MPGDIITLPMCNKNYDQMMYCSWDMVRDGRKDRLTDGRKKWHIEVGAPPKIIDLIFFFGYRECILTYETTKVKLAKKIKKRIFEQRLFFYNVIFY